MLYKKRNVDLLVTRFARKRNVIVENARNWNFGDTDENKRTRWVNNGRTDQWWRNMITLISPEEKWKKVFRMTRIVFEDHYKQLGAHIFANSKSPNRPALSVEKKVALTHTPWKTRDLSGWLGVRLQFTNRDLEQTTTATATATSTWKNKSSNLQNTRSARAF